MNRHLNNTSQCLPFCCERQQCHVFTWVRQALRGLGWVMAEEKAKAKVKRVAEVTVTVMVKVREKEMGWDLDWNLAWGWASSSSKMQRVQFVCLELTCKRHRFGWVGAAWVVAPCRWAKPDQLHMAAPANDIASQPRHGAVVQQLAPAQWNSWRWRQVVPCGQVIVF